MNFFNDKYLFSLDSKFRLLLPKDVRESFKIVKGKNLYLIPNLSAPEFLEVRTESQWKAYQDEFAKQESNDMKKDFLRFAMMSQEKVTVDGQGRFVLSQRIRKLCKLEGTVAVINMGTYIEVWNQQHMEQKYSDMVRAYREINTKLF
jgi:MraZ protein